MRVLPGAGARRGCTSRDAEWLVIRQLDEPRQYSYTLLNAPADAPLERVAELSARRYFVERTFQDAKSELGWAEFSARRYRAWEHHLALTAVALWFVARTKLEWKEGVKESWIGNFHFHDLRHTFATRLRAANVHEYDIADLPGHSTTPDETRNTKVTRGYARGVPQRLRDAVDNLEEGKRLISTTPTLRQAARGA